MPKPALGARPTARPLDEPRLIRKFWMSKELHKATVVYAQMIGSTTSAVIRDQLEDIVLEPLDTTRMTEHDDKKASTHTVSVAVDDTLYLDAKDAAYPTRQSMTSLVRRRLLHIMEQNGIFVR
jgi:hypothetical protein